MWINIRQHFLEVNRFYEARSHFIYVVVVHTLHKNSSFLYNRLPLKIHIY
jgi:hypothetical protein